ncbi:MAG: SulP family inorganic anion transporter, partial [Flavobacteriales bacterium]|nr:SulP family inorganic anion transporter [Flavobacteriales bacterium]
MAKINHSKSLKGDLVGGLTAAIIAIPVGLAFGVASGLGPKYGLYTAAFLAIVASLIGGTKTLISDPTGPMTVVAGGIIITFGALKVNGVPITGDTMLLYGIITFLLAGLFQMVLGVLNIAQYIKFIPFPVISGFMGGIGVIIIVLQIWPLMGYEVADPATGPKGAIQIFGRISEPINGFVWQSLLLGAVTVLTIYIFPFITKKIPSILAALIVGVGTYLVLGQIMDLSVVKTVSSFENEIPIPKLHLFENFEWSMISTCVMPAVTLAALGTIDTLLTSVVADSLTKTKHKGNRELIGQGLGNMITALFGGFPGAGSTTGTVINIKSGGRTNISGITKGVVLLVVIITMGPYVAYIPKAVLAGILLTIGIGIVDVKGLKLLPKVPRVDAFILLLTLVITVFDTLLDAVAVGAIIATVAFMKKMADVMDDLNKDGELKEFSKDPRIPKAMGDRVYVKVLDGPMFFGFA